MRKYIEPKIKAVMLDNKQAILQVCAIGGIYLYYALPTNVTMCSAATFSIGPQCQSTPKGGAGGNTRMSVAAETKAS